VTLPAVSAIITTFNRERFLAGAIASVLGQTWTDLELLVLDNSSTDGTAGVVARSQDPRVRYLRHPPLTIARARNLGLKEARGEFVAFLDDDDEWLPRKLERQVAVFRQGPETLGLVYGGFTRIDERGREGETHHPVLRGRVLMDLLRQRDPFTGSASNPMMPARVLRALGGFDPSFATSEDWELYLRLAERFDVDYAPEVVVRIRSHAGPRLGSRLDDARRVEEAVLARYGLEMGRHLRALYLRKIGGKLCRTGAVREGRAALLRAIWADPLNPIAYGQYCLSFLGRGGYGRAHDLYRGRRQASR
jgi:glycosyltransferase involved in cell wall biosynthesis